MYMWFICNFIFYVSVFVYVCVLCMKVYSCVLVMLRYICVGAFARGAMGRRIDPSWGGPIELFLVPASAPRLV